MRWCHFFENKYAVAADKHAVCTATGLGIGQTLPTFAGRGDAQFSG